MRIDNPNLFANITEYHVAYCAIALLFISKFVIYFFMFKSNKDKSANRSDKGTFWLIIFGWWFSRMPSVYFRDNSIPETLRNLLFPHFIFYIGITFIILGIVIRYRVVLTLKSAFTLSVQTTDVKLDYIILSETMHIQEAL
ncbi:MULTISPECIES: hypothetical protein [unclassified Clostridioides]|uniref:hypothetical protein n=1 Tax=unclassified Clostridioides TaxID=2635829 RepID=UPI001D122BA4|nr:hypothetical protein [Clostridioides sp. ES-S-0005-03]MCC0707211.1 hypothetical protein [Clostridioides sp. ES-S-0190-01]